MYLCFYIFPVAHSALHCNMIFFSRNVETLVRDVNSHMRQRQEQERLKTIIARIDSYEPIETKDEELQVNENHHDDHHHHHCYHDHHHPLL